MIRWSRCEERNTSERRQSVRPCSVLAVRLVVVARLFGLERARAACVCVCVCVFAEAGDR